MELTNFISDFENLPKQVQKNVLDYIEFLMTKYKNKRKKEKVEFKFDWENGLNELKNKFSSVDLQHRANELR